MRRALPILIFILVASTAGPARADSVILKNGRSLNGTIVKETSSTVVIDITGLGRMTVERSRIERVLRAGGAGPAPVPIAPKPKPEARTIPNGPVPTAATPRGVARDVLTSFRQGLSGKGDLAADHLLTYVNKLELLGTGATGDLTQALGGDQDWRVRLLSARTLKLVADPAATAALIRALGDQHYGAVSPAPGGSDRRIRGGFLIQIEAVEALKAIGLKAYQGLLATAGDSTHEDQALAIQGLALVDVPGRGTLLAGLAKDRALGRDVRRLAVTGLAKQGPRAAEVLAELLADGDVQVQAEQALRATRHPAAIPGLMQHVRLVAENHDLARRAAQSIAWIQSSYRPSTLEDAVDFMLLSYQIDKIGSRLGPPALSRLRYWANSDCEPMKSVAGRALTSFTTIRKPAPKPRPVPRPKRPSG